MLEKKLLLFIAALVWHSNSSMAMEPEAVRRIGKQIWHNEASGREGYLTFWSKNESFPSLGIGHNIWLPQGHAPKYTQKFPLLCNYLKNNNVTLPAWLEESLQTGAPWKTREEFYSDKTRLQELRELLVSTVALQAQFMIDQLHDKIPEIIAAAPADQREKVQRCILLMLASELGTYILIDYLHFKGDALHPAEQCNGQPWGLLSVLLDMPDNLDQENVTKAFTVAAAKKLLMLIEHSAPHYKRLVFFGGWMARLNTYTKKINA